MTSLIVGLNMVVAGTFIMIGGPAGEVLFFCGVGAILGSLFATLGR